MTTEEFSNEFDTLLNSYAHSPQFGEQSSQLDINLNEYEKSVFLTQAQEDIVKELYSGKYTGESFERTEELRRELENLVTQKKYQDEDKQNSEVLQDSKYTHTVFNLPTDCLYIVYEQVSWSTDNTCLSNLIADVIPTTHDEYWRTRNNPFRGPNSKKVLRLDNKEAQVELVSNGTIDTYILRYLKKPEPIVLEDFQEESIDGVSKAQTCKLAESIHRDILERAVRLALTSKMINKGNGEK